MARRSSHFLGVIHFTVKPNRGAARLCQIYLS